MYRLLARTNAVVNSSLYLYLHAANCYVSLMDCGVVDITSQEYLFNAQLHGYDESYLPLLPLVHSCMISMYWAIANIALICYVYGLYIL